jgi:NhaC family Na+:H+ antiporter
MIKQPSLLISLLPIILLIIMLAANIYNFGDNAVSGPNQIALIFAAAFAIIISVFLGNKWVNIIQKILDNISDAMPSIIILLLIGALAGTWMLSGIVPTLVYYGFELLNAKLFLFAAVLISSMVSLATGSSWSTIATIGVALFGIGTTMGFSEGLVAGAIISGAYFGDKISPLSDTTNLAPAMAGTDLFTHVKYMLYTTTPTLIITLIIFLVLGFNIEPTTTNVSVEAMINSINNTFFISPVLLVVPIILIVIIIKKVPPIPALFIGILLGALATLIFQTELLLKISTSSVNKYNSYYITILQSMYGELNIPTDNEQVSNLLSTGGMAGMMNTIWLIITAMIFSGAMESANLLIKIAQSIIKYAKSTGSLVASTVATSIFMNITASEQYISIVVPGRMYADIYKKKGLKPEVLSRTLEDGGTVTSVLVPWNTCGAVQSSVLGVSTFTYAPYVFFNIISPFMSIFFAYANIKIRRYSKTENAEIVDSK